MIAGKSVWEFCNESILSQGCFDDKIYYKD